jgi:hypothetical protein
MCLSENVPENKPKDKEVKKRRRRYAHVMKDNEIQDKQIKFPLIIPYIRFKFMTSLGYSQKFS